jgi:hypothetical protein
LAIVLCVLLRFTVTDNTIAKRRRTDNIMAKRRRTDNIMAKRRRTDNIMAKRTNNDLQNTTQKTIYIEQHEPL